MEKIKTGLIRAWTWVKKVCFIIIYAIAGFVWIATHSDTRQIFLDFVHNKISIEEYFDHLEEILDEE